MRQHRLPFAVSTDAERALIDMAFNKKGADARKEWLRGYIVPPIPHSLKKYRAETFVNRLARNVLEPRRPGDRARGLHQQGAHPLLDGGQHSFGPVRRRWFKAWTAQGPLRLLQAQAQQRDQGAFRSLSRSPSRLSDSNVQVVQIAGYISEHSAYHHGEVSLTGTIVNIAQDFVGSNNLNLLAPNGQFGTRLQVRRPIAIIPQP